MKNDIHCYAHYQMRKARAENLWLPALTDANAIQMGVMLVQRALIDDEITEKKAGPLLYSIQIAAANVHKTTFGQADAEMVTEIQPETAAMDEHEEEMKKLKRIQKAKNPPRINTDDTNLKKEQSLPRINADERGLEKQNLPLMNTEDSDLRTEEKTSPRINTDHTDQIGEQNLPLMNTEDTEDTDLSGEAGKMLPANELYANRGQTAEVRANLG